MWQSKIGSPVRRCHQTAAHPPLCLAGGLLLSRGLPQAVSHSPPWLWWSVGLPTSSPPQPPLNHSLEMAIPLQSDGLIVLSSGPLIPCHSAGLESQGVETILIDLYWLSELATLSFHVVCTQFVLLSVIDRVYDYFSYDIILHYMKSIVNVTWGKKHVHLSGRNTSSLFLSSSISFSNKPMEIVKLCLIINSFTYIIGFYLHIYKHFFHLHTGSRFSFLPIC